MDDANESASFSLPTDGSSIGLTDFEQRIVIIKTPANTSVKSNYSDSTKDIECFQCEGCGKYFPSESHLNEHLKVHDFFETRVASVEKPCGTEIVINAAEPDDPSKKEDYKCTHCEKSFPLPSQLKRHEQCHGSTFKGNQGDETLAQVRHPQESHDQQEESFQCAYCDKCFVSASKLKLHEKYHTSARLHKCVYCEKSFISLSQLQYHERYHTGERPFKCDQCDKAFVTKTNLSYHQQSHNEQEKRYKCGHCKKTFVIPSQLKVHERTHTGERPYKCIHCDKAFSTPSQLTHHKQLHTGVRSYKYIGKTVHEDANEQFSCTHCDKVFDDRSSLEFHINQEHGDEKPYKCSYCDQSCATIAGLRSHVRTHQKQTFKCPKCSKTFWNETRFQLHEKTCLGNVEKSQKCSQCSKEFATFTELKSHRTCHLISAGEKKIKCTHCDRVFTSVAYLKRHIKRLEEKPTECSHCKKIFKNPACLRVHQKIHDPENCHICSHCGRLFTAKNLRDHLKRLEGKPAGRRSLYPKGLQEHQQSQINVGAHEGTHDNKRCYCGKEFKSLVLFKAHERIHTDERPFKCLFCKEGFRTNLYLELHLLVHNREKESKDCLITCSYCEETFQHRTLLNIHMRRAHLTKKPFKCTGCNEAFSSASHLGKHRRTHSKRKPQKLQNVPVAIQFAEKPYQCLECGKTVWSRIKRHRDSHLRPHKCKECGKGFARACDLRVHERRHKEEKPYKCLECNKGFARACDLRVHERQHTGEKPYKCLECNKRFTKSSNLLVHERIHTGEKPYSCLVCNKSFTTSSGLNSHQRTGRCSREETHKCTMCDVSFSSLEELTKHEESHSQEDPNKCDMCGMCH